MFSLIFNTDQATLRRGRSILGDLKEKLELEYHQVLSILFTCSSDPQRVENFSHPLYQLATLSAKIGDMQDTFTLEALQDVSLELGTLSRKFTQDLNNVHPSNLGTKQILMDSIQLIISAEMNFQSLNDKYYQPVAQTHQSATIQVHTDLLFQCSQSLFPAERMMVVAGRKCGNQITLGAGFDVTGNASIGHVRADPQKLAQALIAMSASNTHLAAWFHSHPGNGPTCTHPSSTDLKQHADWLHDYSPRLLSGIFVHDSYCRFWGAALDNNEVNIKFVGDGLELLEGENHVYNINPT